MITVNKVSKVVIIIIETRNKGGIFIPNSTTEVWMIDDVDLLDFFHQDLIRCGRRLVFILSNQQCRNLDVESTRKINKWFSKCRKGLYVD